MAEFYFTGNDLIEMGFKPGPGFGDLLKDINIALQGSKDLTEDACHAVILEVVERHKQRRDAAAALKAKNVRPLLDPPVTVIYNIEAHTPEEKANLESVTKTMTLLAATPTVEWAAVMPDACPAGVIPVGGVVAARNAVHPAWLSSDVCCSMFATNLGKVDPKAVLDAAERRAHFGPGGRKRNQEMALPKKLLDWLMTSGNRYLASDKAQFQARSHHGTSGDGLSYAA